MLGELFHSTFAINERFVIPSLTHWCQSETFTSSKHTIQHPNLEKTTRTYYRSGSITLCILSESFTVIRRLASNTKYLIER
jgi:hypothetical protein